MFKDDRRRIESCIHENKPHEETTESYEMTGLVKSL